MIFLIIITIYSKRFSTNQFSYYLFKSSQRFVGVSAADDRDPGLHLLPSSRVSFSSFHITDHRISQSSLGSQLNRISFLTRLAQQATFPAGDNLFDFFEDTITRRFITVLAPQGECIRRCRGIFKNAFRTIIDPDVRHEVPYEMLAVPALGNAACIDDRDIVLDFFQRLSPVETFITRSDDADLMTGVFTQPDKASPERRVSGICVIVIECNFHGSVLSFASLGASGRAASLALRLPPRRFGSPED
nr:MAG TPA: hypothetical protein [Caudoviricetes sp.]